MEEHNYPEEEIDLRGLFEVLWRRKWLILAIIILSVAVAGFFSFCYPTGLRRHQCSLSALPGK